MRRSRLAAPLVCVPKRARDRLPRLAPVRVFSRIELKEKPHRGPHTISPRVVAIDCVLIIFKPWLYLPLVTVVTVGWLTYVRT